MSRSLVLYGASDLGLDAVSVVSLLSDRYEVLGFIDDGPGMAGRLVLGLPVLGGGSWLEGRTGEVDVLLTVGDPRVRRRLATALAAAGHGFATAIHPSVLTTPWVEVGQGVLVMAGCTLTVEITVGDHVVLNPGCTVAHNVTLGAYAYLSPGVDLAGWVHVEEGAYLGTGATVLPGKRIGRGAVVGAGAVVTADVPPDTVVVGVPARTLRKNQHSWERR